MLARCAIFLWEGELWGFFVFRWSQVVSQLAFQQVTLYTFCGSASVWNLSWEKIRGKVGLTSNSKSVIDLLCYHGPDWGYKCAFSPLAACCFRELDHKVLRLSKSSTVRKVRRRILKMLTKWLSSTRLETRTKESNIYASIRVIQTLMHNESKGWGYSTEVRILCQKRHWEASSTDRLLAKDLSKSISVGTRKMVNYAWAGWSQGKLWWRLAAILTCKLFVWLGYRGERLIEPSSSWFPPKFPVG